MKKTLLHYMSKGSWIVLAIILCWGFASLPIMSWHFLRGNVWHKGDALVSADPTKVEVDFLGLKVDDFISKAVGGSIGLLAISFVYLAVRFERLKRRLEVLESRVTPEVMHPGDAIAGP
jgi:hypothetical protein